MPNFKNKNLLILVILIIAIPIAAAYFSNFFNLRDLLFKKKIPPQETKLYLCPSDNPNFCQNGKDITQDGIYLGFGGEVATGSAVLASFDGTMTPSFTTLSPSLKNEKLVTLSLENKDKTMQAIYYFKGDWSAQREVKRGETIGKVLQKIQAYDSWLIFQILTASGAKSEILKISPKDFGQK